MSTKASIICPVYNTPENRMFEKTMDWVYEMLRIVPPEHEIIVVANGCTDATVAFLEVVSRNYPHLRMVNSSRNLGFAGGHNLGLKFSNHEAIIFLENDVMPTGDFITPILNAFKEHGPRIVIGQHQYTHNTGWNTYQRIVAHSTIHMPDGGERAVNSYQQITIPYLHGYCIAMHKQGIEEIGAWDERFFPCDFEDMELSLRATQAGFKLVALPDLPVKHAQSGSTANQLAGGRLQHTLESQRKFMEKWNLLPI